MSRTAGKNALAKEADTPLRLATALMPASEEAKVAHGPGLV